MRIYKRGKIWQCALTRRKRVSLRTKDKDTARSLARRMEREFLAGKLQLIERGHLILLQDFMEEYLETRESQKSPETVKKDSLAIRKLIEIIGNKPLDSLNEADFDRFVGHCSSTGNTATSICTYLRHIKAALSKAVRLGYLTKNPLGSYAFPEQEAPPTRFLSVGDVLALTRRMERDGEDELSLFTNFAVLTGLRRKEILNLDVRDLRFDLGLIHVRKSKAKKERWVPLPPELASLLTDIPAQGKIFTRYQHADTYTHKLKTYLKLCGFPSYRLHDLRHTYASLVSMSGGNARDIQELMGHSDIRMVQRYTHLSAQHLQKVVGRFARSFERGKKLKIVKGKGK